MLQHLSIQQFTIIDALELAFAPGMTVLTGETGAGKSILIDALLLALGGRGDAQLIRTGAERCTITADFTIQQQPTVLQWLQQHDLDSNTDCILRRIIGRDGRSRAFINGQVTPLQQLRELGSLLVNIHGQHEHQTLLKADKQRALLDAYAGHSAMVKQVREIYQQLHAAQLELARLRTEAASRQARQELLTYQTQELSQLNLTADELEALDLEQRQLANAERLLSSYQQTLDVLAEQDEINTLRLLHTALTQINALLTIEPRLSSVADLLASADIQLNEAITELRQHFARVELNPTRLAWVETRLSTLHEYARKHRVKPAELITLQASLSTELQQLAQSDTLISALVTNIETLQAAYTDAARQLSASRQAAAARLRPLIEHSLEQLNMSGGLFDVRFTPLAADEPAHYGLEKVEFLVSTNPGQTPQPLAKIVSGGELSRISLAIQVLTAQTDTTPTLIFDEVDVGIGGGTAEIVGRLLRQLSKRAQVLCVTHLPQVAAQSQQHLQVSKLTQQQHTQTSVQPLDQAEKIQELARMLGGVKITPQTLAHAREMLEVTE